MKFIDYETVKSAVRELTISAVYDLDEDVIKRLEEGRNKEQVPLSKLIIQEILENAEIARIKRIPICQDTGIVVVFLEIGNRVHFDFLIDDAIHEGVKSAYEDEKFRMSVVAHPLDRKNTFSNTPCIIHTKLVKGDQLKITVCPKGAGSENLSQTKMLIPSDGMEGVIQVVIDSVKRAGGKVCPPMIVGVGIGGNFEQCTLLSKEAILRPIEDQSSDSIAAQLEKTLLEKINQLDIGPMGIGGMTTALAVKVNVAPCHIAALPVAVNFQCHASRHKGVTL
ncbi:MAG: fumarate hydratase [Bacilli bacterium]|nr:fumarate hydratase [Bacilli bacterium]